MEAASTVRPHHRRPLLCFLPVLRWQCGWPVQGGLRGAAWAAGGAQQELAAREEAAGAAGGANRKRGSAQALPSLKLPPSPVPSSLAVVLGDGGRLEAWGGRSEEACFVLLMEVLDNMPHDR